jgi:hypothetical protein
MVHASICFPVRADGTNPSTVIARYFIKHDVFWNTLEHLIIGLRYTSRQNIDVIDSQRTIVPRRAAVCRTYVVPLWHSGNYQNARVADEQLVHRAG